MSYGEIIKRNCESVTPSWWPKYAYHFTDVTNVVSILSCGFLYSRVKASRLGVMANDNASRQVIDMTETQATACTRFYFRPLTPTQYHNEGYKHAQLRYEGDSNANVPVPVFLVFDLEQVLQTDGVKFSEQGQSGHGHTLYCSEEDFSKMQFERIYSNGPTEGDEWKYRHAEIICPDQYSIDMSLRMVLCRNDCERATLLNLLRTNDKHIYFRYKDMIRVGSNNVFQRNGLFVDSVVFHDHRIAFCFAQTYYKKKYESRKPSILRNLSKLTATFEFKWFSKKEALLYSATREALIDYATVEEVSFSKLPDITNAAILDVTLRIEDKILCVTRHSITPYELV